MCSPTVITRIEFQTIPQRKLKGSVSKLKYFHTDMLCNGSRNIINLFNVFLGLICEHTYFDRCVRFLKAPQTSHIHTHNTQLHIYIHRHTSPSTSHQQPFKLPYLDSTRPIFIHRHTTIKHSTHLNSSLLNCLISIKLFDHQPANTHKEIESRPLHYTGLTSLLALD